MFRRDDGMLHLWRSNASNSDYAGEDFGGTSAAWTIPPEVMGASSGLFFRELDGPISASANVFGAEGAGARSVAGLSGGAVEQTVRGTYAP